MGKITFAVLSFLVSAGFATGAGAAGANGPYYNTYVTPAAGAAGVKPNSSSVNSATGTSYVSMTTCASNEGDITCTYNGTSPNVFRPASCYPNHDTKAGSYVTTCYMDSNDSGTQVTMNSSDGKSKQTSDNKSTGTARFTLKEGGLDKNSKSTDPCAVSEQLALGASAGKDAKGNPIGINMNCTNTESFVSGIDTAKAVSQAIGTSIQNNVGSQGAYQAATQQTQSAALDATANNIKTAGQLHMFVGAAGLVAGWMERQKAATHTKNADDINEGLAEGRALKVDGQSAPDVLNKNKDGTDGLTDDGTNSNSSLHISIDQAKLEYTRTSATQRALLDNVMNSGTAGAFGDLNANLVSDNGVAKAVPSGNGPTLGSNKDPNSIYNPQSLTLREADGNARLKAMQNVVGQIQSAAALEQTNEASKTQDAANNTLITGVGQLFQGSQELKAAAEISKSANQLAGTSITAPGSDPFASPSNTPISGAITGSGDTSPSAATAANSGTAPSNDGSGGFNPNALDNTPTGNPSPGAFMPAQAATPGGGSSGQGGGSVATSPATGENTDAAPKQLAGDNARYEGGTYGSSGGGGKSGAADKGPDLSGMLAQFLPKKEEEFGSKVLDFGGGRNPASEEPISLLDRNTNIFERIHEAYQDKNRRGKIGVF